MKAKSEPDGNIRSVAETTTLVPAAGRAEYSSDYLSVFEGKPEPVNRRSPRQYRMSDPDDLEAARRFYADPAAPLTDIEGEPIDPVWAAEFRGFFWGEGTMDVQANRPKQHGASGLPVGPKGGTPNWYVDGWAITIIAKIKLRSDDGAVLREFHRRLGGGIREEKGPGNSKPLILWWVATVSQLPRVARILESPTGLPFKKARQLAIWREAIGYKLSRDGTRQARYTKEDRDRLLEIHKEIRALREWDG